MNHLAHFFLSGDDEDIAIGNFVADFITNRDIPSFTEGVKRGIFLHRRIDVFTDAHPLIKQGTRRIHPFHHKYAPVIVDIYYDFLLGKNWLLFNADKNVSLRDFTQHIYRLLEKHQSRLPDKLQKRLPYMIDDDWLMKYTTFDGLEAAFERVEKAAAFPGNFGNAAEHLMLYLEEYEKESKEYFPQVQAFVKAILQNEAIL